MRISDWSSDLCSSDLLHVAAAEAVPAVIGLAQLQWIGLPQRGIERHGIAVPGQHQPAGTTAIAGEQVEFPRRDFRRFAGEAQFTEPGREQRSEERRVGKECVSTCQSRGATYH